VLPIRILERNGMSPPDINLERQKWRHRGPLIGMAVGILIVVSLVLFWAMQQSVTPPTGAVGTMDMENAPIALPTDAPTPAPAPAADQ